MQIALIVVAIVVIVIAIVRFALSKYPDENIFTVLFLILGTGVLFTGLHLSGKTYNYTDAFSLQLPENWETGQPASDFFNLGENVSFYANQEESLFAVGVTRIDKDVVAEFKKDVKDAERQRAAEIKAIKDKELRAAAKEEKYKVQKIRGIKWLAETDTQLSAVFNKRMYTVTGSGNYVDLADTLNIKPFGFFRGISDGYLIPVQGIRAIFDKSLYPYKTANSGFLYILGFIVGTVVLTVFLIGWVYAIVHYIKNISWNRKWNAMTVQEKIAYKTDIYKNEQDQNKNNLKEAKESYKEWGKVYKGQTPENALKAFERTPLPETGFLNNLFSAGKAGLEAVQDHYKTAVCVYEYYKSRYAVSNTRAAIIDTEYKYLREKGGLYVGEIKKIKEEYIAKYGLKSLSALKASGPANLEIEDFDYDDIQDAMESMEELFEKYNIKTEERWNATFDFVFDSLLDENKSLEGSLIESGLALAISGISQYFDNWEKANTAKKKLVEDEHKIVEAVRVIEKNQNRVDAFAAREENLNAIISKSLEWYTQKFNAVYAMLYPDGDISKTQTARKAREAQGKAYYTPKEKKEVALLIFITQKTFKFLNADI
jgi:hypothetical protein